MTQVIRDNKTKVYLCVEAKYSEIYFYACSLSGHGERSAASASDSNDDLSYCRRRFLSLRALLIKGRDTETRDGRGKNGCSRGKQDGGARRERKMGVERIKKNARIEEGKRAGWKSKMK